MARIRFDGSWFTSETGYLARCALGGRKRAAFWRQQDFPNLELARKASARNRKARKQARLFAEEKQRNPFALEKRPRGF